MSLSVLASDSTGWWSAWDGLLFSMVGAIVGGSLVAWLSGYYSEKGKRKLIEEEFPKLLAQARQTAYEEQKGKNVATKEDLAYAVEQIRAVTREAEVIKAEVGERLWRQQQLWTERRNAYVDILEIVDRLRSAYGSLTSNVEHKLFEKAGESVSLANELTGQMNRAFHRLHVMGCAEHLGPFKDYGKGELDLGAVVHWAEVTPWAAERAEAVGRLLNGLSAAAKKELTDSWVLPPVPVPGPPARQKQQ